MVALIVEASGDHAVNSPLLLSAGTGKVPVIPGVSCQIKYLNKSLMIYIQKEDLSNLIIVRKFVV